MTENANSFIDGLLNEIVERVINKLSENNSNWLNNIQYKVKAENIEGQIKLKQIESFEDEVSDIAERAITQEMRGIAEEAAEEAIKNATFEISVS